MFVENTWKIEIVYDCYNFLFGKRCLVFIKSKGTKLSHKSIACKNVIELILMLPNGVFL
jgi:uncharacterized protein with NRDE domain